MEAEYLSKAEDRLEDPGFQNEGQSPALKPDFPLEGQCPGPTVLWDMLEKKFLEYQQLTHKNPEERRKNLLSLLPLFLKAWEHSVGIICFRSLQRLAEDVSDQLAQEIQQALAGKPAEQARAAAGQLLRWKGDMDQDGYLLLKSVYVLTGTDSETLGRVVGSGLPALLLQCLYLFFVFPVEKDELLESDVQGQRIFVQMLLNICSESQGLEGLLSGSELQSLLIATTCLREHSCYFWKEPTFCVLRAISKAQSPSIIQYLRTADWVRLSVQNLSKLADNLPAPEVCEAVNLVLNFVKDSYPVSSALLLEFENGEGYPLLLKVLLRYDGLTQGEEEPHLEELLELVMWLTTCGRSELKVFDSVTYPQLEGFKFHQEASGVTVKNLQAFQVLQNVFHRASDSVLCTKVLLAIKTMWAWNPRNFFLLEWTLQPISQFVEIMPMKPTPVQVQFFQLLETLVFKLLYVPHEILAKVQGLIKESPELSCTLVALQSILRITASDRLFTDIFRDSGLLGLLLAQLRKQAKIMRKSVVLKDHGMVPFIKIFLDDECYRGASLSILEQLSVINAEEYMSIIVGALCSSTQGELQLKLDLLKSLLRILETPKGHAAFRVSSGFNGLLSLLSDLEGSLQVPAVPTWGAVSPSQTLELVLHTLCVVSAALHLDPVNGHFFRSNGLFEKLAEDLCLLGCFGAPEEEGAQRLSSSDMKARPFMDFLSCAFSSSCPFPPRVQSCLQILSFLDNMASGTLHLRRDLMEPARAGQEPSVDAQKGDASGRQGKFKQWPDLEERMDEGDAMIMHPGIICIMVRLLPRLYLDDHPQLSEEIQCSVAGHLLSLVKSEKNRQVMCEAGMLRTLMTFCRRTLSTGGSVLHSLLIRIFEKLGSQAIEPDVLRQFLGLGIRPPQPATRKSLHSSPGHEDDPGHSGSCPDTAEKPRGAIPCPGGSQDLKSSWTSHDSATALQTSLSLISMTSPRNLQPQRAALTPSFVEFDMSMEGEDLDGEATPLIAEERVSFGLHVFSSSITSIMNIRNTYNEVDSRLIAKEMNISSRDNATPVFLLRNCAGHLSGPLRTLGAVAVGQLGVRVFHSSPAASSLDYIGGPAILLGLISLATDDHTMYAAMKVLHSVLTSNAMCDYLMQHICGYQILAFLLRKKTSFLNHRIFQLILSVAGTAELGFRPSSVTNKCVFQHVLCNFELWTNTADNLELALFSHLLDILQSPREGPRNAEVAHHAQLVPKLIFLFNEPSLALSKVSTIIAILGCQLKGHFNIQDFLRSKEQVFLNLGPDWFLLLLQGHLHPSTTTLALKLLLYFLSSPSLRGRFRDGLSAGCWVECSMEGVDIMMDNLKSRPAVPDQSPCLLPGFRVLNDFLAYHVLIPEVYLIVSSFFLQTPLTELTDGPRPPAGSGECVWEQTLPSSILQFLGLVHRSYPQDPAWRTPDFLQTLAIITFPLEAQKAPPDGVSSQQKRDFQSEVLLSTMDIFYVTSRGSVPTPRGSTVPQPNPEAAAAPSLASISYFTQKLVEKLYSGIFSADPRHILIFIIEHIVVVIENPSSQRDTVLSALYSSLNKVILHCLSKPQQSLSECLSLLRILDFLQEHWDIIFATYNSNVSFLLCLMHCLLLLNARSYPEGFGLEPKPRIAPYHQVFLSPNEDVNDKKEEGLPSLSDVQHNIQKSVRTLWQQLVAQRRQTLEDTFKMDLSVKAGESEVKIEEVTPLWEETLLRAWQHYLASEKKSLANRSSLTYHSKVTSWSGSLSSAMRLMPGRQVKDPECRAERQKSGSIKAAMAWARIREQLFGELGLWGQMTSSTSCSQWELDRREGPARMRKRIRRLFSWEALNQVSCKVSQKFPLVIVQGHLVSEGILLFGQQHFYICENFTLSPTGDVYCTRHCLSNISDPFIFNMCSKDRSSDHYSCQRHAYSDLRVLRPARFLLQDIALEIFFQNGYSKLLVFYNNDRSKASKSFCTFQPNLKGKVNTEDPFNLSL
ncbi:hypothetical protein NN561_007568 [Cricetulus griseus]